MALLGSRGIPAKYGGFEGFVQELAEHLPKSNFEVYVACESSLREERALVSFPGLNTFYIPVFERFRIVSELLYDGVSLLWAAFRDIDIVCLFGYAAAPFCLFPRMTGKIVTISVDGLEWKRRKFPKILRVFLRVLEMLATRASNFLIADSQAIRAYYEKRYHIKNVVYFPYWAPVVTQADESLIKKYGVEKNGYYLVVARLEPENNIDLAIEGFKKSNSNKMLVIVGPLVRTKYVNKLIESKNDRIIFVGGVYDRAILDALRFHSFAYIHGHEVGGTNPSLVEALGCGCLVIAFDVPFNREVAQEAAMYFKDSDGLAERIRFLEKEASKLEMMRASAQQIVRDRYSRGSLINQISKFFLDVYYEKHGSR